MVILGAKLYTTPFRAGSMKKAYLSPVVESFGSIENLTRSFGSDPSPDVSEFPQIPASNGSFDICKGLICGGPG